MLEGVSEGYRNTALTRNVKNGILAYINGKVEVGACPAGAGELENALKALKVEPEGSDEPGGKVTLSCNEILSEVRRSLSNERWTFSDEEIHQKIKIMLEEVCKDGCVFEDCPQETLSDRQHNESNPAVKRLLSTLFMGGGLSVSKVFLRNFVGLTQAQAVLAPICLLAVAAPICYVLYKLLPTVVEASAQLLQSLRGESLRDIANTPTPGGV
jgi:putative flippase GtrA